MPTPAAARDIHAKVTSAITAAIEANPRTPQLPWLQSTRPLHLPRNVFTGNAYSGINILQLWATGFVRGYEHQLWASYRQWAQLGAQVRQGERGTAVAFYKTYEVQPKADNPDDDGNRRVLKTFTVFNIHQVTGYAAPASLPPLAPPADPWAPLEPVEDFIATTGADIRHGGDQAFFHRTKDFIQMPERASFIGTETSSPLEAYYSVLFHELTHWTGASFRLNRTFGQRFGDQAYAAEELVAELGAASPPHLEPTTASTSPSGSSCSNPTSAQSSSLPPRPRRLHATWPKVMVCRRRRRCALELFHLTPTPHSCEATADR